MCCSTFRIRYIFVSLSLMLLYYITFLIICQGVFLKYFYFFHLVPVAGVEPARCCHRRILNPLRLPIPSHRQIVAAELGFKPRHTESESAVLPLTPILYTLLSKCKPITLTILHYLFTTKFTMIMFTTTVKRIFF